jgi:type II secretory pathway component GspD/PulD (secretin)
MHMDQTRRARWFPAVLLGAVVLGLVGRGATPACAADTDPDTFRALDIGDGLVTLDVQDAPFLQVVTERIQPRTRVNIYVTPEAGEQRVTLRVVDLHWVQALQALTERIGGSLVKKASNLLRVERPQPVTMSFTDEDVRKVISSIASFGGASVIVSEKVKGTVTLTLNDTPWRAALEQVVRTVGFALVEEDYGLLKVLPMDELELESLFYRFRYVRPPAPYRGVIANQASTGGGAGGAGGGGGGGGGGGADIIQNDVWVPTDDPKEAEKNFPIIAALRQIVVREGGEVNYIPLDNAVTVNGTKPKLAAVKQMLDQYDVEPPQVFIDMNFVVTRNSDALDLGLADAGPNGLGFRLSGADILHGLPFNAGGSTSDLASAITGTGFPSPAAGAFGFGTLSFSQTDMLFKFLQRDSSTKIVQAPKLLALDNHEATIFIGESVRYARTQAATNQNGGLTFAVEEDPNSPVNVGFQLLVIPHVIPGDQKIMMLVIPQRRELNGTGPVPGFDRITVSGQSIDLPRVQSTTLKTEMILRSGETAVIGGLLADREIRRVDKVPILGDIPFLGLAFQGKSQARIKEHLLILITPRILRGSDAASCTINEELSGVSHRASTEWQDLYGRAQNYYPGTPCDPPPNFPCAGGVASPDARGWSPPPAAPGPVGPVAPAPPPPPAAPVPMAPGR